MALASWTKSRSKIIARTRPTKLTSPNSLKNQHKGDQATSLCWTGPRVLPGRSRHALGNKKRKVLAREQSRRVRKMVITSRKVVSAFPDDRLARKTSPGPSNGLNRVGGKTKRSNRTKSIDNWRKKQMVIMRQNRGNGKCTWSNLRLGAPAK